MLYSHTQVGAYPEGNRPYGMSVRCIMNDSIIHSPVTQAYNLTFDICRFLNLLLTGLMATDQREWLLLSRIVPELQHLLIIQLIQQTPNSVPVSKSGHQAGTAFLLELIIYQE
jgi:hypothetical protein